MSIKIELSYDDSTPEEKLLISEFLTNFSKLHTEKLCKVLGKAADFTEAEYAECEQESDAALEARLSNVTYSAPAELADVFRAAEATPVPQDPEEVNPLNTEAAYEFVSEIEPIELDSSGLPWDERIHSAGRTKTKGGLWRVKKNMTDAEVNTVLYELRTKSVPHLPVPPAPPEVGTIVAPPPPPAVTAEPDGVPFENFMKFIVMLMSQKRITNAQILDLLAPYNVANIPALQARPDLIETICNEIKKVTGYGV